MFRGEAFHHDDVSRLKTLFIDKWTNEMKTYDSWFFAQSAMPQKNKVNVVHIQVVLQLTRMNG